MINVNTLKPGITFQENGEIFVVMSSQSSHQGRGTATVKVKTKNLRTGAITIKAYTGGDKIEPAMINKKDMDFLYNDGTNIVLMDQETFEQIDIPVTKVKWELNFLKEGNKVKVRMFGKEILDIEIPVNIELKVIESPDAVKGNTQSNPQKKVVLETGFEVEAPMFIKTGEIIVVSSVDGKYVGRGGK